MGEHYPPPAYGMPQPSAPGGMGGNYPTPTYGPGAQPPYKNEMGGNYPPPPYGMPQPSAPVFLAPVVSHTTVIYNFQDTPAATTCPACRQSIITRIVYNIGLLTWLIFGILLLFGCWLGCCLIPFCVDSCKDVDHFCPNCNHHLYKFKRL
uniref:LITAF domain-containing protein n=1 Tax=Leptobrachium leishanense TaxID=445787 RepID=A0A8C5QY38_9ANUR